MKNCLIVLGMHRSGTSAFTGILDLLGVNLGTKMLETQRDNPKGFFENKYVVLANDCILESFNSAWDDPIPLPQNWPARFENSQLLEDARAFLRTDIPDNQLSALKDPRLCRLLPFWLPLLKAENITPRIALVIRNPLEIADSLQRRNGFSLEKSLVLWMQYMLEAERNSRHLPRDFVRFEAILHDPQQSIERLFHNVGLDKPNFSAVQPAELDQFLDHTLRHHDASEEDLKARCHNIIADYYRLLCKISEGDAIAEELAAFDDVGDQFQSNQQLFYNKDVVLALERAKEENTPSWYHTKLNRIKTQFDTDKLFREYRYLANTEHLYQERIALHRKVQDQQNDGLALKDEITNLQKEISKLQNQLLTPHIRISDLRKQIAADKNQISVLQQEVVGQSSENTGLRSEIANQRDEIRILQSAISTRLEEIAALENEVSNQQQARLTLQNVISAQKLVISALQTESLSRQQAICVLQAESMSWRQVISDLKGEIKRHKHALEHQDNVLSQQKQLVGVANEELDQQRNENILLLAKSNSLEALILRIYATRVWRAYRLYQRIVDALFPENTLLRKMLHRSKQLVMGTGGDKGAAPPRVSNEHSQLQAEETPQQQPPDEGPQQHPTGEMQHQSRTEELPRHAQIEELTPQVEPSAGEDQVAARIDLQDDIEQPTEPVQITDTLPDQGTAFAPADTLTNELDDSDAQDTGQNHQTSVIEVSENPVPAASITFAAVATASVTDGIYAVAMSDPVTSHTQEMQADPERTQIPNGAEDTALPPANLSITSGTTDSSNSPDAVSATPAEDKQPVAYVPQRTPVQEQIAFVRSESPRVSIIIPVFNNWAFTEKCLHSLYLHVPDNCELIVVDNNSTDETPTRLAAIRGLRVITNETNEVFVNACNQAADVAKGDYLLFLNNDTEVSAGWLDALLAPFSDPSTGIVGAKLIYPDGRLQEAGGIIWSDGNGCNYGHGDNPDLPQYSYRKAVDYCSGACLVIPHSLWKEIGGFDERFAPAYYEDTDLCFSVRALNYKVVYQPAARVIHYGGASAGKETSSGYKRYQDINRLKFIDKWREVLDRDHVPSSAGLFRARERNGAKQILIIDHQVPTYDRDSGSLRMLNLVQILQTMDYKVSFWPDQLTYDPRYTKTLQDLGIEAYYGEVSFEDFIKAYGNEIDAVLMSRPVTAKKYLPLVKKYSKAKTIFDTVDLHYIREQRRLDLEVQRWKNLEFFLAEEADTTLVVSPYEKKMLADESFSDKVAVVSNIHSLEPCLKGFEERKGLMFIGSFAHPPNEEGIIWFIEYIFPLINRKIPDIHLTIVGSEPTERLLKMANPSITVTGYVEDVSEYFNDNKVFIAPLLHGAGVKGKIGQSFSYGLPVVTTSIGAEGMHLTDGLNILISDSETEFANSVVALYREKFLWQKLSTNCREIIREQFSTETTRPHWNGFWKQMLPNR
jgi:GT2 family glycosyltransferase